MPQATRCRVPHADPDFRNALSPMSPDRRLEVGLLQVCEAKGLTQGCEGFGFRV